MTGTARQSTRPRQVRTGIKPSGCGGLLPQLHVIDYCPSEAGYASGALRGALQGPRPGAEALRSGLGTNPLEEALGALRGAPRCPRLSTNLFHLVCAGALRGALKRLRLSTN